MPELKPHILVVDDMVDNRELMSQFLEDEYRVTTVSDGQEAIAAIEAERPDLLLLDLMMPVLDGFGVLAHLQLQLLPFLPVIVVTAATEREERLRALRAGAHEFLAKPVDDEELYVRIATLLALKRAREEVEQQALELTRHNAALEEASRFKSLFLATMSHEIRTPLTAIIGFAQLLQERGRDPQEVKDAQHVILNSGRHLLHVINHILDSSRIEAGKLEVERISFDLLPLLSDIESLAGMQAKEKGLEFVLDLALPLPVRVFSDPTRLKQILLNLCNNAIKFTLKGEVRLHVSCDPAGERLQLVVSDTGIGMSEAQAARLFQPYIQASASTARQFGGTGLGLYISRELAEALEGSLSVTSILSQGSRFVLDLPTGSLSGVVLMSRIDQLVDSATEQRQIAVPNLAGGRVLLAEDTPANQRLIGHFVRQTGASLAVVDDGRQAVEEALSGDYDLVLMDMHMPVMGGLEATTLLREVGFARPIVALTANVMQEDVSRYLRAGCTAWLAKPIDRQAFFAQLALHLDGLPADRAGPLGDDEVIRELAEQFAAELGATREALHAAAEAEDWVLLRSLAHRMRGTAGSLGFPALSTAAGLVEDALRQDKVSTALVALVDLESRLRAEEGVTRDC